MKMNNQSSSLPSEQDKTCKTCGVPIQQVGQNGFRVGYNQDGDAIEWWPDEETGEDCAMITRRNDEAIQEAEHEIELIIWYGRKLDLQKNLKDGTETIDPEIEKGMLAGMKEVEKKYGKRNLKNWYNDPFEWAMLHGKLSALRWVLGAHWDELST